MILGLRTAIYHVPDLRQAKAWYAEAFGVQPYFDEPFYVGFNIGGYELGLDPDPRGASDGVDLIPFLLYDTQQIGATPIDKDVALRATRDVLRIKTKAETFARPVGFAGFGLGFLPALLGTAIQEVATAVARRWFEKDIQRQLVFVERAVKYDEQAVRGALDRKGARRVGEV